LVLKHCRSEDQMADVLTKAVQTDVFKWLKNIIDLYQLATMN
jgi:hypothetical protein